jgi:hypothetical protein
MLRVGSPTPAIGRRINPYEYRCKDVTRDTARDLSALVGEFTALKGDAAHWLTDPEYATLNYRLEAAHAAAEAALVEARRRVRLDEERGR